VGFPRFGSMGGRFCSSLIFSCDQMKSSRNVLRPSRQRIDGADCGSRWAVHHLEIHWPAKILARIAHRPHQRRKELKEKIDAAR